MFLAVTSCSVSHTHLCCMHAQCDWARAEPDNCAMQWCPNDAFQQNTALLYTTYCQVMTAAYKILPCIAVSQLFRHTTCCSSTHRCQTFQYNTQLSSGTCVAKGACSALLLHYAGVWYCCRPPAGRWSCPPLSICPLRPVISATSEGPPSMSSSWSSTLGGSCGAGQATTSRSVTQAGHCQSVGCHRQAKANEWVGTGVLPSMQSGIQWDRNLARQ
jgi:hypothetical protein